MTLLHHSACCPVHVVVFLFLGTRRSWAGCQRIMGPESRAQSAAADLWVYRRHLLMQSHPNLEAGGQDTHQLLSSWDPVGGQNPKDNCFVEFLGLRDSKCNNAQVHWWKEFNVRDLSNLRRGTSHLLYVLNQNIASELKPVLFSQSEVILATPFRKCSKPRLTLLSSSPQGKIITNRTSGNLYVTHNKTFKIVCFHCHVATY